MTIYSPPSGENMIKTVELVVNHLLENNLSGPMMTLHEYMPILKQHADRYDILHERLRKD